MIARNQDIVKKLLVDAGYTIGYTNLQTYTHKFLKLITPSATVGDIKVFTRTIKALVKPSKIKIDVIESYARKKAGTLMTTVIIHVYEISLRDEMTKIAKQHPTINRGRMAHTLTKKFPWMCETPKEENAWTRRVFMYYGSVMDKIEAERVKNPTLPPIIKALDNLVHEQQPGVYVPNERVIIEHNGIKVAHFATESKGTKVRMFFDCAVASAEPILVTKANAEQLKGYEMYLSADLSKK